jgi:hypothetical protein
MVGISKNGMRLLNLDLFLRPPWPFIERKPIRIETVFAVAIAFKRIGQLTVAVQARKARAIVSSPIFRKFHDC